MHLTVVQQEEALSDIRRMTAEAYSDPAYDPIYGAKTLVLVSARPKFDQPLMESCNAGCILENMLLQATELGIASVYLLSIQGAFAEGSPIYGKLDIPDGFKLVSGAAFGYTDEGRELVLDAFDERLWMVAVESVTVDRDGQLVFSFKSGDVVTV